MAKSGTFFAGPTQYHSSGSTPAAFAFCRIVSEPNPFSDSPASSP